MTIGKWLKDTEELLDRAGLNSTARLDAQLILGSALHKDRSWLLAHPDYTLDSTLLKQLARKVERRLKREPIAYITGRKQFYGREFIVSPDVLIPRPETEQLIEAALQTVEPGMQVLDVGTGSGCVAVTLALERPEAFMTACDISPEALSVARKNAQRLRAAVKFFTSDLLASVTGRQDVIVANLPYVSRHWAVSPETNYEPDCALFADEGGLAVYKRLIKQAAERKKLGGHLLLEADPRQGKTIEQLAKTHKFRFEQISGFVCRLSL